MATIRTVRKRFEKLDTDKEIIRIFEKESPEIIRLNQEQLYKSSQDSLGRPLQLYKSAVYSLDKQKQNPGLAFGRPDLKLTGAFYSGFFVSVGYTGIFTVDSKDSKAGKLEAKYGFTIYGLDKANKTKFGKEKVYPGLLAYVKRITML